MPRWSGSSGTSSGPAASCSPIPAPRPCGWRWRPSRRRSPERPVAFPAYACYDLASAALGAGTRVLLYDLDTETLGPDWPSLERSLEAGATAVVVVHLFGIPVDMDRVGQMARAHGAAVIEDAAQAVGAAWRGRPAGEPGRPLGAELRPGQGLDRRGRRRAAVARLVRVRR